MTHTPGPWTAMPYSEWEKSDYTQASSVCHVGDFTIATSHPSYEFHAPDENDARLIAAAPDLLAALREMEARFGPLSDNPMLHEDVRKCFGMARAAIAKATSE